MLFVIVVLNQFLFHVNGINKGTFSFCIIQIIEIDDDCEIQFIDKRAFPKSDIVIIMISKKLSYLINL